MHIGFLTSDLTMGHGWGLYSLSLIQALRAAGVEVSVITARNQAALQDFQTTPLLPTVAPPDQYSLPRMMIHSPHIRRLLDKCDVIHTTVEPYAPLAQWLTGKRPTFITIHGSYAYLPRLRRFPINHLYRRAYAGATLICVSRYTERVVVDVVPGVRSIVVPNGVDVSRFQDMPPSSMKKRGPIILSAGGVKKRKGTLELIRAIAVVREKIPDVQCAILGKLHPEPVYVEQVRAEIARLHLEDTVHLPGFVPDDVVMNWYAAADVFVMPSINTLWRFEGFGLVHLEASAVGLPVIGTTNCGAEDAIEDGVTGLLVAQDDLEASLPHAILDILKNPERAREMGAAGREKAQSQTWDHVAQTMIGIYEAALH